MIPPIPPIDPALGPVQPQPLKYADVDKFRTDFEQYHTAWTNTIRPAVLSNRMNRELLVDVDAMRAAGTLQANQTYIAQRIIDINIAREMPAVVAYLTQSRRLALFENVDVSVQTDTTQLETEFRRVLTYTGWVTEFQRWADGGKTNGYSFISTYYDPSKPGAVANEFVPSGMLAYDLRVKDIQMSPMVFRAYEITTVELEELAAQYEFDTAVTDELMTKLVDLQSQGGSNITTDDEVTEAFRIYQGFYKEKGIVQTAWYSKELQKFLKPFAAFYNGVDESYEELPPLDPMADPSMVVEPVTKWRPAGEVNYPYKVFLNRVTEREQIVRTLSRVDIDFYMQEASCSLVSAFVNGCTQSSNTLWSPDGDNMEAGPSAPKQLTMQISPGAVWNKPMRAFTTPWPDSMLLKSIEYLRSQNSEDTNQVSFAVNNRRDTRKTATEIEAAQQQDTVMNSVQVTNWADALGPVFEDDWRIIQSQALQGKITFCSLGGGMGNNLELIGQTYKIIPAGTTDYVERIERITAMAADLPVMLQTAAGPVFLEEYLRAKYPMIADKLIQAMQQQQQASAETVKGLVVLLDAAVKDENGNFLPEWQGQAQTLAKFGIQEQAQASDNLQQGANETAQASAEMSTPVS